VTAATEAPRHQATDAPTLQGVSHLAFSVADLPAATDFWTRVMGFELTIEGPGFRFLVHYGIRLGLGLADHDGTVEGRFDEHRVGLDHVALAVSDLSTLETWARWLEDCGVSYSPIVASDAGHNLNLRGPDDFPVELFVMNAATAAGFGLSGPADAVARTHS
jgi:glyoxylase I family protein